MSKPSGVGEWRERTAMGWRGEGDGMGEASDIEIIVMQYWDAGWAIDAIARELHMYEGDVAEIVEWFEGDG